MLGCLSSVRICSNRALLEQIVLTAIACVSVTSAVLITLIDVSIAYPGIGDLKMFHNPSLAEAMTAALNIILAFGKS